MRNSDLVMCPEFSVKWDNDPFKLLGETLSVNLEMDSELIYVPKTIDVKRLQAIQIMVYIATVTIAQENSR